MKAQYRAIARSIALLSSVAMANVASAGTVILSFEQIADGHSALQMPNQGPISYFVPVDVNGAPAAFELQVIKNASGLFDGTVSLIGQTSNDGFFNGINFGGNFNGITYYQQSFQGAFLLGPQTNLELPLLNVSETFTIPEQTGNPYSAVFTLSPSVNGFIAVAAPERSTWAMMLLGFVGLGWLAKRRRTVIICSKLET